MRVGATTASIFTGQSRGFERAVGGAKARYIFYRPALFENLDGGSFDIGDGRDTTWASFRVKATKQTFYYVDVHLDNGKGKADDARRAGEMDRMLAQMARINPERKPMIYAGDFNSGVHRDHDSPGVKMRAAGFVNTELLAQDVENAHINTGHTFSTAVPQSGAHIDHVWVSGEFDGRVVAAARPHDQRPLHDAGRLGPQRRQRRHRPGRPAAVGREDHTRRPSIPGSWPRLE